MTIKTAFLTTVFPMEERYLEEFFRSLDNQSYKKFDIIVINDGYSNLKVLKDRYDNLSIIEVPYSNTPAKNREHGINYVLEKSYDFVIFGDSDDYFQENRVEVSLEKLKQFDIVVNDLSLFNENSIYAEKYISNRVENNRQVDFSFILDKNIFGLSNTAVNVNKLKEIYFDAELIAVDWYLFSLLLLKKNKAVFTNDTLTYYRQYADNTVGLGNITRSSILKCIAVKLKHYELMKSFSNIYNNYYNEILAMDQNLAEEYVSEIRDRSVFNPLWWEEI